MSQPPSLCSTEHEPSLRPDLPAGRLSRAGAVNDGRRPPPKAARSVMDGPEHGGMVAGRSGQRDAENVTKNTVALPRNARARCTRGGHARRQISRDARKTPPASTVAHVQPDGRESASSLNRGG